MALKKSELYSSLWQSCDELRGGMDASQYKDYVLVLLFVKYVSDRYAGEPYAAISILPGASFADMVALKGKSDIGDQINKKILGPLSQAAAMWLSVSLRARELYDLPPLFGFFRDALSIFGRREGEHRASKVGEARLHLGGACGRSIVQLLTECIFWTRPVPSSGDLFI